MKKGKRGQDGDTFWGPKNGQGCQGCAFISVSASYRQPVQILFTAALFKRLNI